jgi:hypothetical protein
VLDVACRRDDDVPGEVHRPVIRGDRPAAERRDHLGRAYHGPAKRMRAERRLLDQIVDELLWLVLVHGDLLEHDLALSVELGEAWREDHLAHHVERRLQLVVRNTRVDDGVLPRGGRVQLPSERVEDLGDLLRRVRSRALEEQVLDEVRDAGPIGLLVAGARPDPEADRNRTHMRQPLGDHALPGIELAEHILLHPLIVLGGESLDPLGLVV